MSWSEGADRESNVSLAAMKSKQRESLANVNGVLSMFAADEDLHEDLQLPIVKVAMAHWTNTKRLPADQAVRLTENTRVLSVLQKFQRLSSVCQAAGIGVPLDHLLARQRVLSDELVERYFPALVSNGNPSNSSTPKTPSSSISNNNSSSSSTRSIKSPSTSTENDKSSAPDSTAAALQSQSSMDKTNPFQATGEPTSHIPAIDAAIAARDKQREQEARQQQQQQEQQQKQQPPAQPPQQQTIRQRKQERADTINKLNNNNGDNKVVQPPASKWQENMRKSLVVIMLVLFVYAVYVVYLDFSEHFNK